MCAQYTYTFPKSCGNHFSSCSDANFGSSRTMRPNETKLSCCERGRTWQRLKGK